MIAAAAAPGLLRRPSPRVLWPLGGVALLLLPWLPLPVPPAFAIWAGRLTSLVWIAVVVAVLAATGAVPRVVSAVGGRWPARGWHAPVTAGVLAFLLYLATAVQIAPRVPAGDEPHYLVITQTLLNHGHLRIEATHQDEAYKAYYPHALPPHFVRRGADEAIYSIHAPGLSILVMPAFLIGGYAGVVAFLALVAALCGALAWRTAFVLTGDAGAAWFGWAVVALSAPFVFHAVTIYPDMAASCIVLMAFRPLVSAGTMGRWRWAAHGTVLALLPWLHTRYAVLAASLAVLSLVRWRRGAHGPQEAIAFLAVPVVSALAWLTYFFAIYGVPDPRAAYGWKTDTALAHIPAGFIGLLVDQQFGVLSNAPGFVVALGGLLVLLARRSTDPTAAGRLTDRGLALALLIVTVPYTLAVASYAMWWGGLSAPGRFALPILPLLAVPAAAWWAWAPWRAARSMALATLVGSVYITAVLALVDRGALLYNVRGAAAQWVTWLDPAAEIAWALPSVFDAGAAGALVRTAVWCGWIAMAWYTVTLVSRRTGHSTSAAPAAGVMGLATILAVGLAATGATATNWSLRDGPPVRHEDAKYQLLDRFDPVARPWGLHYGHRTVGRAEAMLGHLRLERSPDAAAPAGDPLAWFALVPAGRYTLVVEGAVREPMSIVVGRHRDGEIARIAADAASPSRAVHALDLPVDVHSIVLHGSPQARHAITLVTLRPEERYALDTSLSRHRAVRARSYGETTTYFLDEGTYVERDAFWAAGETRTQVVFAPMAGRDTVPLEVRNGAVANRLELSSGVWSDALDLAPGESRRLDVPTPHGAAVVRLFAQRGFRPSDVEPGSTDRRFLGVRLEVR